MLLFANQHINVPRALLSVGISENSQGDDQRTCAMVTFVPNFANAKNPDDAFKAQMRVEAK